MGYETIRKLLRVIDTQEFALFTDIFHPDICYLRPGYEPLCGLDRVLFFYRHERIISSGVHFIGQIVADDHAGACWGRFEGESRDGRKLAEEFADVYRFVGHRIVHRQTYFFRPAI